MSLGHYPSAGTQSMQKRVPLTWPLGMYIILSITFRSFRSSHSLMGENSPKFRNSNSESITINWVPQTRQVVGASPTFGRCNFSSASISNFHILPSNLPSALHDQAFNEYLLRGISKECKHSPARTIVYIWSSWKKGARCITMLFMLAHSLTTSGRFVRAIRTVSFMITIPMWRNTRPRGAMELIAPTRPSACKRQRR